MKQYFVEQNSVEWYQLRLGIPTASSFHKIITAKKWQASKQAEEYMDHLIAERISGEPEDLYQSEWMQRGQEIEDTAIRGYEWDTGEETAPGGFFTNNAGTAGASPDRLVGLNGLVEIKSPKLHTQVHVERTGDLEDYHTQLQGQLLITEREWVDVYHYHPQMLLPPQRVYRDEDFLRQLKYVLGVFIADLEKAWEGVQARRGPFERKGTRGVVAPIEYPEFLREEEVEEYIRLRKAKDEISQGGAR